MTVAEWTELIKAVAPVLSLPLTAVVTVIVIKLTEPYKGEVGYANRLKEIQVTKYYEKMLSSLDGISLRLSQLSITALRSWNPIQEHDAELTFEEFRNSQRKEINDILKEISNYHESVMHYLPSSLNIDIDMLILEYGNRTQVMYFQLSYKKADLPEYYNESIKVVSQMRAKIREDIRRLMDADNLSVGIKLPTPRLRKPMEKRA